MEERLEFGTDGIRGHADRFPFSRKALIGLGKAIAVWSKEKYGRKTPRFLLAHDTRISCTRIKHDLLAGLQAKKDAADAGILPTPAVLQLIKQDTRFDFGIVISASHNPYYDNGIKLFDATGGKLSPDDEACISSHFFLLCSTNFDENFSVTALHSNHNAFSTKYQNNIRSYFPPHFLAGKKIVLDCAHGATCEIAPALFSKFGAQIVCLGTSPNGRNINEQCGALHPKQLQKKVLALKADCGFAFDGDGDRVIAVNNKGKLKDGDDLLAILLAHPNFTNTTQIVGTIMTNHGFARHLNLHGKRLLRTPVGDKYVTAQLEKKHLLLGGETSGHIIMMDYLNVGDGIFVALRVLETIIATNNWTFSTFKKFPQVLINVPVKHKNSLTENPYAQLIKAHEKQLYSGRLIVRYSGTENLLRIMIEDIDFNHAHFVANSLAKILQRKLRNPLT